MKKPQQGVFLIEALVAILIFSIGILGLVSLGGVAISAQSDAQYRTEAANLANKIAAEIALDMARSDYAAQLPLYAHHADANSGYCNFTGPPSTKAVVTAWQAEVLPGNSNTRGLPGAVATGQQIKVETMIASVPNVPSGLAVNNRITVTVCWRPPVGAGVTAPPMHRHTLVAYIN